MRDDELREAALRIYRRYQLEIVEALHLCPWAEPARREGRVREIVLLDRVEDPGTALDAIETLAADPSVEVGLLIYPRLDLTYRDFESLVARIVREDGARHPLGTAPFALAAFHPDAPLDLSDPERLIPFLRRTPDPTIQLVRMEALERVRKGTPEGTSFVDVGSLLSVQPLTAQETLPLRTRIARNNHRTVTRAGSAEVEARLASIRRDRDKTYARIRRGASRRDASSGAGRKSPT